MNTPIKYIAVSGNLLGYAHIVCKLLKLNGINSVAIDSTQNSAVKSFFPDNEIFSVSCPKRTIKHSSLVISLGPSIFYEFGLVNCFKHFILKRKLIAFITQGSDITEYINGNSLYAKFYKYFLKKSVFNLFSPYKHALYNLHKHHIYNVFFACHPHKLPICSQENIEDSPFKKLTLFHCSNLDWGETDNKQGRNSTKGNDRFLRAFHRAVTSGLTNIHCYILDRGPDKELVKKYITENNLEEYFTWHKSMKRDELHNFINKVDIVVDQFDVGGLGGIACEAMAQAKPVMIYIDENCWPLVYNEEPPVINCHTEDEIYNAILEWSDKKKLKNLGEKAEKWVRKYHDVHTADFSEFILRVCLAAGLEWPRKDLAKQGE